MYLIDTNVISELTKNKPNSKVIQFLEGLEQFHFSVITLTELNFGINCLSKNNQKLLLHWLDSLRSIAVWFPVTDEIAIRAGSLRAISQKKGINLSLADGLIAATAELDNYILVTRNIKDFKGIKISLLNPFSE